MSASADFHIKQQLVIEFLTLEVSAPMEIHRHMKEFMVMVVKNVCK